MLSNNEQEFANIETQMAGLKQKYSQQHMNGFKPESHMQAAFKAPYIADGSHPVPVSNFLNAQCKSQKACALPNIVWRMLTGSRLLRDLSRNAPSDLQGCPRHGQL